MHRGFSLIELLVAMGLMIVLAAGYGLAERGGGTDGLALRSAQAELASVLGAARAKAILLQTAVRVVIHAARPPRGEREKYLRCLQVAVEQPAGSGQWVAREEPIFLPRGVLVVPPLVSASQVRPGVAWPVGPSAPVSTIAGASDGMINGRAVGEIHWIEYAPDGRIEPAAAQLVIATARAAGDALPCFDSPAAVRGLRLYASGSVGWINHADEF